MKSQLMMILAVLFAAQTAMAGGSARPLPEPTPSASPIVINLTPDTLKTVLLTNNISIEETYAQVITAKATVDDARAALLPSVSVTGLLNITSGPSFVIKEVSVLLPFLFPTNWFDLSVADDQYKAEELSFKIMELNTYAAALSLFYTLQEDYQAMVLYNHAAEISEQMREIEEEALNLGTIAPADYNNINSAAQTAKNYAAAFVTNYKNDFASMRQALGLPVSAVINLPQDWDQSPLPVTPVDEIESINASDSAAIQKELTALEGRAPEYAQINELIAAAHADQLAGLFSFLGTEATVSALPPNGSGSNSSASLSNLQATATGNIGFGLFTEYKLSDTEINQLIDQGVATEQSQQLTLEQGVSTVQVALNALNTSQQAESSVVHNYEIAQEAYNLGTIAPMDLLTADSNQTADKATRIKAQLDLNLLRITLHRLALAANDPYFGSIEDCDADAIRAAALSGKGPTKVTLDEACHKNASTPSATN